MADQQDQWISPQELNQKIQESELPPQVIDVRPREMYQAGHIPDAVNIPGDLVLESSSQIDTKRPVVVYCNMHHPGASSSEKAAKDLRGIGVQARVLKGGLPAWEQAGFSVDKGERFQQYGKA